MAHDIDLYGGKRFWPKALAIGVAVTLLAGFFGYRWITTATPVTRARALDLYRSARGPTAPGGTGVQGTKRKPSPEPGEISDARSRRGGRATEGIGPTTGSNATNTAEAPRVAAAPEAEREPETRTRPAVARSVPPAEGVYSWTTDGYEEAGGARRSFPKESQRIVTHTETGWQQHHYFSEEREIWTRFELSDAGASISYQRNKVVFGPIAEDSAIAFSPAMLVGPRELEVGSSWNGSWKGDTYGNYTGRVFENRQMTIGDRSVEVWGIEIRLWMRGEQNGTVDARVWLAPSHSLTVREEYVQDVRADVGSYHAEWTMTVKSLDPRT